MKAALLILASLIFAVSFRSVAQRFDFQSSLGKDQYSPLKIFLTRHRQAIVQHVLNASPAAAQKITGSGERVIKIADYDYRNAPGSQRTDSVFCKYSGARSSVFNYFDLKYDFQNNNDLPDPVSYGQSHINFDSMWLFGPSGSINDGYQTVRNYTAANNIARDEILGYQLEKFTYNGANQLVEATSQSFDSSSMTWVNGKHYYLFYNAAGHLILDSMELWTGTDWEPYLVDRYAYNANGLVANVYEFSAYFGPLSPYYEVDFTYKALSNLPNMVWYKAYNPATMSTENSYLDTLGYTNGALTVYDGYHWDDSISAWLPDYKERRRLNSYNKPDSTWTEAVGQIGGDSTSISITYDVQNNPTSKKIHAFGSPITILETHWYYESNSGTGVTTASIKPLEIFPNPVRSTLYLRNSIEGDYVIHNSLGQMVQAGRYQRGIPIPLNDLSPGQYVLQIETGSSELYSCTFVKE